MPWPLPAPGDISGRAAAVYEAEFARIWALKNPSAPPAVVDARSPYSTLAVHARVIELSAWDIYLYQARLANELMPDTAEDWLSRHGTIWGVPQDQPTPAAGNATVAGASDLDIPAGTMFSAPSGALYATTAAVVLSNTGTGSLPVQAELAGSAGNLPAATVLTPVSPIEGLNPQTATVDGNAITGGQDLESIDSWRARILARIQQRGGGGSVSDYIQWTGQILQNAICTPSQMGLGIVMVTLAISQGPSLPPIVPTTEQVAIVQAYLSDPTMRKPLGMTVVVVAATLVPVNFTLHLNPDTTATEAGAISALRLFFLTDAKVAGTIYMSRADAALSNSDGEFSHERIAPTVDQVFTGSQLPVLGTVTFQ